MIANLSTPCFVDYDEELELLKTKHGVCSKRKPIERTDKEEARKLIQILVDYRDKKKDKRGRLFKGSRETTSEETSQFLFKKFARSQAYVPQKKNTVHRVRLSKDISRGREKIPIPAYCDRDTKSADITMTSGFEYLTENYLEDDAQQRERRKICYRCDCSGGCTDERCPCIRLHLDINCDGEITNVRDGRVKIKNPTSDMYTYMLLVCGDRCSCPSSCPNRIENITHRLELFRRDISSGFGIRTLNSIHMGELVMEFIGRVMPGHEVTDDRVKGYAMELFESDNMDAMPHLIERMQKATGSENDFHWEDMPLQMHVDPYAQGSVSRFIQHGCYPNLIPLRVAANYLHPTEHKIYFYAGRNIVAGEELFFNYGAEYFDAKGFPCTCGTPLCENGPHIKEWKSLTTEQAIDVLLKLHKKWDKKAIQKDAVLDSDKDRVNGKLDELPKETQCNRRIKDEMPTERQKKDKINTIIPKTRCSMDKMMQTLDVVKDIVDPELWQEAQEEVKDAIRRKAEAEATSSSSTVNEPVVKTEEVVVKKRGTSVPQACLGSHGKSPSPSSGDSGIGSSTSKSSEGTGSSTRSSPAEEEDEIEVLEVVPREEKPRLDAIVPPPLPQKRKLSGENVIPTQPKKPNAGTDEDPVVID